MSRLKWSLESQYKKTLVDKPYRKELTRAKIRRSIRRHSIQVLICDTTPTLMKSALSSTQTPSVQHKGHTFSATKIPQFNTKNHSVQHTDDFLVLNSRVLGVEPRDFWGLKGMAFLCWTDVLNWRGPLINYIMPEVRFWLRIYSACQSKGWKFILEFSQLRSRTQK